MGQVMINFRLDEETKNSTEQACREMGLSMTAAFTVFAKKVGKEKRIPFEVTAECPDLRLARRQRCHGDFGENYGECGLGLARRRDRLELLCGEIRRSLTAVHVAIPASITGLPMEQIRLLCGDELKDKSAQVSNAVGRLFSGQDAGALEGKDLGILDEYIDGLSSIAGELLELERTLIPDMKSCSEGGGGFEEYGRRLAAVSQKFDSLVPVMRRYLYSAACTGGGRAVVARIRKAAAPVGTAYVLAALEGLEALVIREFDGLEEQAGVRLEGEYLQTLELTLQELGRAEREAGDVGEKAALCLRVINILTQVIAENRRARQEWDGRSLEAEVAALERLAAMRGETAGGMQPDS